MEEKDYKEIAKIIKTEYDEFSETNNTGSMFVIKLIAKKLANSFELSSGYNFMPHEKVFNKEQFLKDCGASK